MSSESSIVWLAVEMLALKIRQDQLCRGIELLNGQNAKISQFADDTTLILDDATSLRNAMNIVNSFGVLSGLQLNKRKQKPCGLVLPVKMREPLKFQCPKEPINFLELTFPMIQLPTTTIIFISK